MKCCKKHVGSQTGMEVIYNNPSPPVQPTPGNRWTTSNWSRVVCSNSIFSGCLVKGSKKALPMPKFALKACSFFFRNISLMELKSAKTKLVQNIGSPFKRDVGDCVHGVKSDIELVVLNLNQSHCGFIPTRPWAFPLVSTHGSTLRWLIRWHRDTDTLCLYLFKTKECPDLMFQIYWLKSWWSPVK